MYLNGYENWQWVGTSLKGDPIEKFYTIIAECSDEAEREAIKDFESKGYYFDEISPYDTKGKDWPACKNCGKYPDDDLYYGHICPECNDKLFYEFSQTCKELRVNKYGESLCMADGPVGEDTDEEGNSVELYPACGDSGECMREDAFIQWVKSKFSE